MLATFSKLVVAKKIVLISGPIASYIVAELISGSVGWGLVVSGFFSMVTAIFVTRPKLIAAKAAAIVSNTTSQDSHVANVVATMNRLHGQEIDFWKHAVAQQRKVEILIRATKHRAFGAYQAGIWAIREREDLLKDAGIKFPLYRPVSFYEITGDEDRKMVESLFPELLLQPEATTS